MRERYIENIDKDGKVENGDVAVIDFEGFKDGVAFEGGKGENYPLELGSGSFIPGFEDQLVGASAGAALVFAAGQPARHGNLPGKHPRAPGCEGGHGCGGAVERPQPIPPAAPGG